VNETAELFITLLNCIISDPETAESGRLGYYFAENGEVTAIDTAFAISTALHELGLNQYTEPAPFSIEELEANPKLYYLGTQCRCRADRSRSLGWTPSKTTVDLITSIRPEVEAIIKGSAST